MAGHRESDILAYILAAMIMVISGIAVGVASTTPPMTAVAAADAGGSRPSESDPSGAGPVPAADAEHVESAAN